MRLLTQLSIAALAALTMTAHAQPAKGGSEDMEFEPDSAKSTPPSKTLERAIKLYDKKEFDFGEKKAFPMREQVGCGLL